MEENSSDVLVLSDFNARNLLGFLQNTGVGGPVRARAAPYGQVAPILLQPEHEVWDPAPDGLIVWTRPEGVLPAFRRLVDFERVDQTDLMGEVDRFAELVTSAAPRAKAVFVPSWTLSMRDRGWGMLDSGSEAGFANALARINLRLAERFADARNVFLLDSNRWLLSAGREAFSSRLWYTAKVPFGAAVFKEAAADVAAALTGVRGHARKLVIVDLDNTLWGGVVGDVGWANLQLGGHDGRGEAFVAFQRALKALTRRGILLGIVSKNEETVALEAIASHPEMVLTASDFAGMRINWDDKAQNLVELTAELELGLQSVVFLDDNPVERARVGEALPEVLVPEFPDDPMEYARFLRELRCFDVPAFTNEDAKRAQLYAAQAVRKQSRTEFSDLSEWLRSLETAVTAERVDESNITRVTQLLNKTNQMNLSTRRLTRLELEDWLRDPKNDMWAFRVTDRFGDSGLTGVVSLALDDPEARIIDFVLSCRVMGRHVEEAMLSMVIDEAARAGHQIVNAELVPTAKNMPCLRFWREASGFEESRECLFQWSTTKDYPMPPSIDFAEAHPSSNGDRAHSPSHTGT